jgi:hypothetical protein
MDKNHKYFNYFFPLPEKINYNLNMLDIAQVLYPNMISADESERLGTKTVVSLYTKFSDLVKQNPGLTNYYVSYPWSASCERMTPRLEKDFELILGVFGWKVIEWSTHNVTITAK